LNSTPRLYQQWLEKIINKTIYSNRADERIVFVNAWNEWAEGNHLEPCQKWGRSYLEATKSGVQNGLKLTSVSGSPRLSIPAFTPEVGCKESSPELAESLLKLVAEEQSPGVLLISFENFSDLGEFTYLKGWAVIDDGLGTRGDDIQILVHKPGSRARLIIPAKRNRPDVTSHFGNKFNYDYSGFEVMTRRIDLYSSITVVIKRNSMNYWQEWRGYDG
jgi:hypothetical protein